MSVRGQMRGLTIIVAEANPVRLRSALGLALSAAALGAEARLFLDTAAVALLRAPIMGDDDAAQAAAGMPTLAGLVDEALDVGVGIMLCQAGMAIAGASAEAFDPRIDFGGMVSLLATLGEDRLVMA